MKYVNSLVFLGLMIVVAGCQKKEKDCKKGPTKLETKKSMAQKNHLNKKEATEKKSLESKHAKEDVVTQYFHW